MSLFDNLPHRCNVLGPAAASRDAGGGTLVTWPTVRAPNVPCLVTTAPSSTTDRFDQDQLSGQSTICFSGAAAVQRGDLIVLVGGRNSGARMRVTSINDITGVGGIADFLVVTAELVK